MVVLRCPVLQLCLDDAKGLETNVFESAGMCGIMALLRFTLFPVFGIDGASVCAASVLGRLPAHECLYAGMDLESIFYLPEA